MTVAFLTLAIGGAGGFAAAVDPFSFLLPTVTVNPNDRRVLDRGDPIARVVPARERQVAIFAATATRVDPDRLVAWTRQISELKKSRYVEVTRRFSSPPRLDDLAELTLDDDDLDAIRRCRPGRCDLQLAGGEMDELRRAADDAGQAWKPAALGAFKRVLLRRVDAYLAGGHAALAPFEHNGHPERPADAFSRLMRQSAFLSRSLPDFSGYLERFPQVRADEIESFVYWSKERFARKAVVSVVHVGIVRGQTAALPEVVIAGKGIFATRYLAASLGVTSLLRADDGRQYLAYLNRSEADALGGFFGGIVRLVVERRLKAEADDVLEGVRKRIESGAPPGAAREATEREVGPILAIRR